MWISPPFPPQVTYYVHVHPLAWVEPIGDVGYRTGTRREGACQGYFTLGGGAASLGSTPDQSRSHPRKWGGERNKKEKITAREPDLTPTAGSGSNGGHAVGRPKHMLASAADSACSYIAPAPGATGSLVNLG